jgi:uncharacterized protein (TIGR02147 family)
MDITNSSSENREPIHFSDYRSYLRYRWETARTRRPEFTQGAFARRIGLPPNRLSEIFSEKQGLSPVSAAVVGARLGLSDDALEDFCALVAERHGRSALAREAASDRLARRRAGNARREISPAIFERISDWYYFALLEWLQQGPEESAVLAERLGIPVGRAVEALHMLRRLGFAERADGKWRATGRPLEVRGGTPSEAIRKYHRQILERALGALQSVPTEEREFVTVLIRANPEQIAHVRARIREFWSNLATELSKEFARSGNNEVVVAGDSVKTDAHGQKGGRLYALAMQYFPLGK